MNLYLAMMMFAAAAIFAAYAWGSPPIIKATEGGLHYVLIASTTYCGWQIKALDRRTNG